jgi:hypothetical protein
MPRMKVIAVEDADTWPVEAVLADLDDPEGPLLRWRQGPRSDATTIEVEELLGDGTWRFVDLDLPPDWDQDTRRPGEARSVSSKGRLHPSLPCLDGC